MAAKKGRSSETPMFGVRITHEDQDVLELLKAAKRDGFAPNISKVFIRTARLFLDPIYGHLKRVQNAKQAMAQSKHA